MADHVTIVLPMANEPAKESTPIISPYRVLHLLLKDDDGNPFTQEMFDKTLEFYEDNYTSVALKIYGAPLISMERMDLTTDIEDVCDKIAAIKNKFTVYPTLYLSDTEFKAKLLEKIPDGVKLIIRTSDPIMLNGDCLTRFPNTKVVWNFHISQIKSITNTAMILQEKGFTNLSIVPDYTETYSDDDICALEDEMNTYTNYIRVAFGEDDDIPLIFTEFENFFLQVVMHNCMNIPSTNRTINKGPAICHPVNRCGIGNSASNVNCVYSGITIDPTGNIYSCKKVIDEQFMIGTLDKGIDHELIGTIIREITLASSINRCSNCKLSNICTRGCAPIAAKISGTHNVNDVPETYCIWSNKLFDAADSLLDYFNEDENVNLMFNEYFSSLITRGVICGC